MRVTIHSLVLCAVLLTCAAAASAQEQSEAATDPHRFLSDPVFRLQAGQAGGGKRYALMAIPAEARLACYEWLVANVKAVPDQALECRLQAWLARELHRPSAEIQKADDLVLQAAPDLCEGWLNRAAFYQAAAAKEPEKTAWALETFAQGLRRLDLAAHDWRSALADVDLNAWFERALKSGKLSLLADALAETMHDTKLGASMVDAAPFLRDILLSAPWRSDPACQEKLLEAVAATQPHLVLGDALSYIEMARTFETAGQRGLTSRIARMLLLAPVPKELALPESMSRSAFALHWNADHPAPVLPENATPLQRAEHELAITRHDAQARHSTKLRDGWLVMQAAWEDTMPRYLPMTQARELLRMATADDVGDFADAARAAAAEQPWNESLISHGLVASALDDNLEEDALSLAASFDVLARLRLALRLHAFAPSDHLPHEALGPWLMDGVMRLLTTIAEGEPLDRADNSTVLQTLDAFDHAKDSARLRDLLAHLMEKPPRSEDADHWQRLSKMVMRHGREDQVSAFAGTWTRRLAAKPEERQHLSAASSAAVRGGVLHGKGYADLALGIWTRHYAERTDRTMDDAVAASAVSEALLACEDLEGFSAFVLSLEKSPGDNAYSVFGRMTKELSALQDLLSGGSDRLPAVDAWVQAPSVESAPARVHWRFVLPELDSLATRAAPIRIQVVVGGREAASNMSVEETPDGRWWTAGTPHPLLRKLAGRYTLAIAAGNSPQQLRDLATIPEAADAGSIEVPGLPLAGCIRILLRAPVGGARGQMDTRLYSLRPTLFSTGMEPDALGLEPGLGTPIKDHHSPATWSPHDDERWGRLLGPPIAIEDGTEYLLTQFTPPTGVDEKVLPAQLILLDERQRPLGPVPLVSVGFHSGPPLAAVYTKHHASTQRFRASDWGWAEDLVCLRDRTGAKGEQTIPARYMAFVSRGTGDGVLPLVQLRRYREPVGGTGSESSSASELAQMPELNGEYVATGGFRPRSWHITMGPQRAIICGEGRLAGFDVGRIPWKPLLRVESHLLLGNEWPMCFAPERALMLEPSWTGDRKLGVRFVPLNKEGENYSACERRDLPLRTYTRSEFSINRDGALLMLASANREKPEPVAAWLFPDGRMSVCPLPRPPLKGSPDLDLAWWGPPANQFTLHEDGMLFEMEVTDELRLVGQRPGTPSDMPPDATPPKSKKKPQWKLERPDILAELDTKTGATVRRFHLPQPCEAKPIAFTATGPVFLFTTEHDIIRVNPPPLKQKRQ